MSIKGIDISYHQGNVNFSKVKADGVNFVILREGYRNTIDKKFLEYIKGCNDNNLPVMVYHFIYTNGATIKQNAESTIANIKKAGLDVATTWVWVDLEGDTWKQNGEKCTKERCSKYIKEYISEIKALGCKRIGIYINNNYYKNYISDELKQYPIWLADYTGGPDVACVIQQTTSKGYINGISGNVDVDYLFDESMLDKEYSSDTKAKEDITMNIIIGSARSNEYGGATGGEAGDQKNGQEVSTQAFYVHNKGWYVLRAKSDTHANELAKAMQRACDNNKIGYCQTHRADLLKYGTNTTVATECDCSSLVRLCIKEATGKDVGNFTTYNEASVLESSGLFEKKVKYTNGMKLKTGDILVTCSKGHTVICTSGYSRGDSTANTSTDPNVEYYPKYTGNTVSIVEALRSLGIGYLYGDRQKIAKANGIENYSGSAAQNTQMLNLLKQGKLRK